MESTPLTAAERKDLEELEHRFPTLTRLLDERDALAAQLAEARGIARRLVEGFRCSRRGMNYEPLLAALAAFDALHWPDPKKERVKGDDGHE